MTRTEANQKALLSAIACIAIIGCTGEGSDAGAIGSFSKRDSAGVPILLTPGPIAFAPLGWEVDSVPDLVLGREESAGGSFYRIGGVNALRGGKILVVDGGNQQLKLFDPEGRLLESVGGRGRGPAEFIEASLVRSVGDDSIVVFDHYNLRFQVFSSSLDANRTQRVTGWAHGRRSPIGRVGLKMLRLRSIYERGSLEGEMQVQGPIKETKELYWYDPTTGATIALDSVPAVRMYVDQYGLGPLIPFSSTPAATVGSDAALITNGRMHEVREYDLNGHLRRILRVDQPRRPVSEDVLERKLQIELAGFSDRRRPYWAARYAELPIPDSLPAFQSLVVDELGSLWAQIYHWNPYSPKDWIIFDPNGRARGTVQTPAGLEVHSITRDHVYGVWRSEFDVEFVHRHRLRRTGRQAANQSVGRD